MILLTVIIERSRSVFHVRSFIIFTYSSVAKIVYESINFEDDALA
jgi:HKD family nuclease